MVAADRHGGHLRPTVLTVATRETHRLVTLWQPGRDGTHAGTVIVWNGETVAPDGRPGRSTRSAGDQLVTCQPKDPFGCRIDLHDTPDGILHEKPFVERVDDECVEVGRAL